MNTRTQTTAEHTWRLAMGNGPSIPGIDFFDGDKAMEDLDKVNETAAKGTELFAKLKPIAKAISAVKNFAGKLGLGGVTQRRILARKDWLGDIFSKAGYKRPPGPTMGQFKILAADIPNRLTDRTYAPEFERIRKWAVAMLNYHNPGLGDLYASYFPTWPMSGGGEIYREPIEVIQEIVKIFPPKTFTTDTAYKIQAALVNTPDQPVQGAHLAAQIEEQSKKELAEKEEDDEKQANTQQTITYVTLGLAVVLIIVAVIWRMKLNG